MAPPAEPDPAPRVTTDELSEVIEVAARLQLGSLEQEKTVQPDVLAAIAAQGAIGTDVFQQAHGMVRQRRRRRRVLFATLTALAVLACASPWWAPIAFAPPTSVVEAPALPAPPLDPQVATTRAAALHERAAGLRQNRQFVPALAAARQAVALRPMEARHQLLLAQCLEGAGLVDEAERTYRTTLQMADRHSHSAARQGLAGLLERGDRAEREEAAALYRRILVVEAPAGATWQRLALVEAGLGRRDAALAAYRSAVAFDPSSPQPRRALAEYLIKLGRDAEAQRILEDLVRREPREYAAYAMLSRHHLARGRGAEALRVARRAVEQTDASRIEARLGLAQLLEGLGRNDEAIAAYRDAVRADDANLEPWRGLGRLYARLGRRDEAIAAYEQAGARAPDDWNRDQFTKEIGRLRGPR